MAAGQHRSPATRWAVRGAVVAGTAVGVRKWRDRAVAANTLRYDHVLDPTKPFLGTPKAAPDASSDPSARPEG